MAIGSYLQSPVRILDRNAKVSELLNRDTTWWNLSLIHKIFSTKEAGLICGMAMSPRSGEDHLIWHYNKNGEFTVRSTFRLAKEKFEVDSGSCSNIDSNKLLWKAIPRAAISFLSKACSDILQTKDKLFKKHITLDLLCPICYLEVESIGHTLWSCPSTQNVWAECSTRIQKSLSVATDFMSITDRMLERCSVEEV
jgi:hypothetical protein